MSSFYTELEDLISKCINTCTKKFCYESIEQINNLLIKVLQSKSLTLSFQSTFLAACLVAYINIRCHQDDKDCDEIKPLIEIFYMFYYEHFLSKEIKLLAQDQSIHQCYRNSPTETTNSNDSYNLEIERHKYSMIFANLIKECKVKSKLNNLKLDAEHLDTLSFVHRACWSDPTIFAIFRGDVVSQREISRWLSNENSQSIKARLQIVLDSDLLAPLFRLLTCLMAYPSYQNDPSITLLFLHLFYYFQTMFEKEFILCLRLYVSSNNTEPSHTNISYCNDFDDYNHFNHDESHQDINFNKSTNNAIPTNISSKPNDEEASRNLINNLDIEKTLTQDSSQFYSELSKNSTNLLITSNNYMADDINENQFKDSYQKSNSLDLEQMFEQLDANSQQSQNSQCKEQDIVFSSTNCGQTREINILDERTHLELVKNRKCACIEHKDILHVLTSHNIYYLCNSLPTALLIDLCYFRNYNLSTSDLVEKPQNINMEPVDVESFNGTMDADGEKITQEPINSPHYLFSTFHPHFIRIFLIIVWKRIDSTYTQLEKLFNKWFDSERRLHKENEDYWLKVMLEELFKANEIIEHSLCDTESQNSNTTTKKPVNIWRNLIVLIKLITENPFRYLKPISTILFNAMKREKFKYDLEVATGRHNESKKSEALTNLVPLVKIFGDFALLCGQDEMRLSALMSLAYLQPCKKTYYAVEAPFIGWQKHQDNLKRERILLINEQKKRKIFRNAKGLRGKTKIAKKNKGKNKKADGVYKNSESVFKQPTNIKINKLGNGNKNSSSVKKNFNENIFASMMKIKQDFSHKLSNEADQTSQKDIASSSFGNIVFQNENDSNLNDIEAKISCELIKNFNTNYANNNKNICSEKVHCIRILTEVHRICNALREISWRLVMKWDKLKRLMLQHLKGLEGKKRAVNSRCPDYLKSVQLVDKHRNHMAICKKIKIDVGPRVNNFFKESGKLIASNFKAVASMPKFNVNITSDLEEHKSKRASSFSKLKDMFSKNNFESKTTLPFKDYQMQQRFTLKEVVNGVCSDDFNPNIQTPVNHHFSYFGTSSSITNSSTNTGSTSPTTTVTTNSITNNDNDNNNNNNNESTMDMPEGYRNTQNSKNDSNCEFSIINKSKILSKFKNTIPKNKCFKSLSKDVNYQNINVKGLDSKFGEFNKSGYISFHNKEFSRKINSESNTSCSITDNIIDKDVIKNDDKLKDCKIVLIKTNSAKIFGKSSTISSTKASKTNGNSLSNSLSWPASSDKKVIKIHPLKSQCFMLSKRNSLKKKSFSPSKARKVTLPNPSFQNPKSDQSTSLETSKNPLNIPTNKLLLRNISENTSLLNVTSNAVSVQNNSNLVDSLLSVTSEKTVNIVSSPLSISLPTISVESTSSKTMDILTNISDTPPQLSKNSFQKSKTFDFSELFYTNENQNQPMVIEKKDDTKDTKVAEFSLQETSNFEINSATPSLETFNEPIFSNASGTSNHNEEFIKEFDFENKKSKLLFESFEEYSVSDSDGVNCSILSLSPDPIANPTVLSDTKQTQKDSKLIMRDKTKNAAKIISKNTFMPNSQTTEFELTFENSYLPFTNTNVPDTLQAAPQKNYSIEQNCLEDGILHSFPVKSSISSSSAVTEVFGKENQDTDVSMRLDEDVSEEDQIPHFEDYALEEVVPSFGSFSPPLFSASPSPQRWKKEFLFSEESFGENEAQCIDLNIDENKEINLLDHTTDASNENKEINLLDHTTDASNVNLERPLNCFICCYSLSSLKDYKPHFYIFHSDY